ncbi:Putative major intrinsic protein [Septoria linicola]|uniref:Major intrinsic protein n=1 Tax=Septoria linicola TaxID=215465 RepID=A0A9Q9AW58_9PEZI|nr:putative major intrinsic protein [Septoria linicola]USW56554.1 Putative major intrinsic protein [Septoria linicola]
MASNGQTTSYDYSPGSYSEKDKHDDHPLALHNLPTHTGGASHHEHAHDQTLPQGEKQHMNTSLDLNRTSSTVHKARRLIGLHPDAPIIEEHDTAAHADLRWTKMRAVLKEPLAEFFGVMIMVCFGNGSVAQVLLSAGQVTAPGGNGFGDYQSISWGWGLGVMLGIYIAGDSGAYLNPAITLTNCFLRKVPLRRFPIYLLAQFLGGFVGAGIVYGNYINGINAFEGGAGLRTVPPAANATAAIFCTYPQEDLTKASQFFSEFIASAILMFTIFALRDDSNSGSFCASGNFFPLTLFFLIFGLGACFGWNTGYAINLARDFGPRLFSYIVGYGGEVWSAGGYYFWIPMVAPFLGCLFGGCLYDAAIYTGPSPVNAPWFGIPQLLDPKKTIQQRVEQQKEQGLV